MFTFGLALAAPVMLSLLLADIALAVMARSMPQLNVFVLSFSVKIVLGLIGLAVSVKFAGAMLTTLFESTWRVLGRRGQSAQMAQDGRTGTKPHRAGDALQAGRGAQAGPGGQEPGLQHA